MEKEFIRVRSAKDIIISASFIIIGSILLALQTGASINLLGFCMLFGGIILALTLRNGYKDTSTGKQYCKIEHFFSHKMRDEIKQAISLKPESVNLAEENKGNGLRLDIYYAKSSGMAYMQLFEYIPYKYEACTAVYEYERSKISKLIK